VGSEGGKGEAQDKVTTEQETGRDELPFKRKKKFWKDASCMRKEAALNTYAHGEIGKSKRKKRGGEVFGEAKHEEKAEDFQDQPLSTEKGKV